MKNRKSFRCEFLDWHTPTTIREVGITILVSTCKRCGRRIIQDRQGNWVPILYSTATQKEAEK